ncbi:hypothetical protein BHE74_00009666 [Ensete ventricosum]|nr:hypothetical protein BHE74_00009666 [Ensete ventricosum]
MRLGTRLECVGSLPVWRKGVRRKKTEICQKIVGVSGQGLDDAVGARWEFARTLLKVSRRSLGTCRRLSD